MPPVATQPPFGAHRRREGGKRPGLASLGTRECAPRGRCNAGRCHLVQSASTRGAARNAGTRRREGTNLHQRSTGHPPRPCCTRCHRAPAARPRRRRRAACLSKRYFKIPRASYSCTRTVVRCATVGHRLIVCRRRQLDRLPERAREDGRDADIIALRVPSPTARHPAGQDQKNIQKGEVARHSDRVPPRGAGSGSGALELLQPPVLLPVKMYSLPVSITLCVARARVCVSLDSTVAPSRCCSCSCPRCFSFWLALLLAGQVEMTARCHPVQNWRTELMQEHILPHTPL